MFATNYCKYVLSDILEHDESAAKAPHSGTFIEIIPWSFHDDRNYQKKDVASTFFTM